MHEILKERLLLITLYASVIKEGMSRINNADALKTTEEGEILLDSLITRLQALSENVKRIQKEEPSFFQVNRPIDVNPIVSFRDIASHHYELLKHTIIYKICKSEVPEFKKQVHDYLLKEM